MILSVSFYMEFLVLDVLCCMSFSGVTWRVAEVMSAVCCSLYCSVLYVVQRCYMVCGRANVSCVLCFILFCLAMVPGVQAKWRLKPITPSVVSALLLMPELEVSFLVRYILCIFYCKIFSYTRILTLLLCFDIVG